MPSIRSVHNYLDGLSDSQKDVVGKIDAAIKNVQSDKSSAVRLLQSAVQSLVITSDTERYAALTQASKASGEGTNYTTLVEAWTHDDKVNREEKTTLEETWGKRDQVHHEADVLKNGEYGINEISAALDKVSKEIKTFDDTSKKIDAHNQKHPKAAINAETFDKYKKTNFWRWLGYVTFTNRGPHKAYQTINAYEKLYGNYYEDVMAMPKNRETEKQLTTDLDTKTQSYKQLVDVENRMSQLDDSYRGPEGIASTVRQMVTQTALEKESFVTALTQSVPGVESQSAALGFLKVRGYKTLERLLSSQHQAAKNLQGTLQTAAEQVQRGIGRVGSETVNFNDTEISQAVDQAARISIANARAITVASDSIDEYKAAPGTNLVGMQQAVAYLANVQVKSNSLSLDFSGVVSAVNRHISDYEAEQERLRREAARRAAEEAERRRKAAAEAAERSRRAAQEAAERSRRTHSIGGGGISRGSSGGHSISRGGIRR